MADGDDKEYCLRYLRRKYPWPSGNDQASVDTRAASKAALENLADEVFADATESVTITSLSFEGASGGGQRNTFNRRVLGAAIEDILAERDITYTAPKPQAGGIVIEYGCRY